MSTKEEPGKSSAESEPPSSKQGAEAGETVALVDFFDQLDRAAFTRSLAQRKNYYSLRTNRES